jgi:hypothetical protein
MKKIFFSFLNWLDCKFIAYIHTFVVWNEGRLLVIFFKNNLNVSNRRKIFGLHFFVSFCSVSPRINHNKNFNCSCTSRYRSDIFFISHSCLKSGSSGSRDCGRKKNYFRFTQSLLSFGNFAASSMLQRAVQRALFSNISCVSLIFFAH